MAKILPKANARTKRVRNVAATISDDDLSMQPWFLPSGISVKVKTLIPAGYREMLHQCFKNFGCFRCDRKNVLYGSIGFCERCRTRIRERLSRSRRRHQKRGGSVTPASGVAWYINRITRAEELLADLKAKQGVRKTVFPAAKGILSHRSRRNPSVRQRGRSVGV